MKKTRWIALAAVLGLLACLLAGCGKKDRDPREGVVRIVSQYEVKEGIFEGLTNTWTGSAFGVGKAWEPTDVFVTNRHVVENQTETVDMQAILDVLEPGTTWEDLGLESRYYDVEYILTDVYILLDDYACKVDSDGDVTVDTSRAVPCQVLYQSEPVGPDIAILQAANEVPGRVALPMVRAEEGVKVGDGVTAIGFPGDSDITAADEYDTVRIYGSVDSSTLTKGVVSRFTTMASEKNTRIIQHGAQISSGNSGGPLINDKNQVVAINTWGWGDNSQGAIYVDYAMDALEDLHIDVPGTGPDIKAILIAVVVVAAAAVAVVLILQKKGVRVPGKRTPGLVLTGVGGYHAGRQFPLGGGQMTVGRDPINTIVYPAHHPGISARHCCLWTEGGAAYIRDLGSTYGTYVNGSRLAPGENLPLTEGATIQMGSPDETFTLNREGGV